LRTVVDWKRASPEEKSYPASQMTKGRRKECKVVVWGKRNEGEVRVKKVAWFFEVEEVGEDRYATKPFLGTPGLVDSELPGNRRSGHRRAVGWR